MPVTKTAKRALRSSLRKNKVNKKRLTRLNLAIRLAKSEKKQKRVDEIYSLADRASKNKIIHKNKASRIKKSVSRLLSSTKSKSSKPKRTTRKSNK